MNRVAVLQPNYIPWKGYFDIIHDTDVFIFYDDVKYTKNDWRNRNIIRGPKGPFWLTIPVPKSSVNLRINQVVISDSRWRKKHLSAIKACYSQSPFFDEQFELIKEFYEDGRDQNLATLDISLIQKISEVLGIKTEFLHSSDFSLKGNKTDRLIELLQQIGTDEYISGPSAKGYIDEEKFDIANIKLIYKDYTYPIYHQIWDGEFNHNVSVIDLLFNTGKMAPYYIWGWKND
jgi:hypothetical protein